MVNRCYNTMEVLKCGLPKILNSDSCVDFNIAVPMTKNSTKAHSMIDTYCFFSNYNINGISEENKAIMMEMFGCNSIELEDCIHYFHMYEFNGKSRHDLEISYSNGRMLINNYKQYGWLPWISWPLFHWGVIRNAENTKVFELDENFVMIQFETIDTSPDKWLAELNKMGVLFKLSYHCDSGRSGEVTIENGQVMHQYKFTAGGYQFPKCIEEAAASMVCKLQDFLTPNKNGRIYSEDLLQNLLDSEGDADESGE